MESKETTIVVKVPKDTVESAENLKDFMKMLLSEIPGWIGKESEAEDAELTVDDLKEEAREYVFKGIDSLKTATWQWASNPRIDDLEWAKNLRSAANIVEDLNECAYEISRLFNLEREEVNGCNDAKSIHGI